MKKITLLLAALSLTGCQNVRHALFPGDPGKPGVQDPSGICRATPSRGYQLVDSNSLVIPMGEINGQDGVSETVFLCHENVNQRPPFDDVSGCPYSFTQNGVSPDGVMVEFDGLNINVKLALVAGYSNIKIRQDFTCHE